MPYDALEYHKRELALNKLRNSHSPLAVSAMESLDAALWLLGGRRVPQALSMLHNAIELALKGELEHIHRALIADNRRWGYEELKSILRESFLAHPRGANVNIPEFDIDRTITFDEAINRVKDLYPSLMMKWESQLKKLHSFRNMLIHYGHEPSHISNFIEAILMDAIPFLDNFVADAYDCPFEEIVMESVHRELKVAQAVIIELRGKKRKIGSYVLKTVYFATLYRASIDLVFVESDGTIIEETDRDFELAMQARREFEGEGNDVDIEDFCHICNSHPFFVSLELHDEISKEVRAKALRCFKCGLSITKNDTHLAHFHFGQISKDDAERYLRDIGML